MKQKDLNSLIADYREQLANGDLQIAYAGLMKYMQRLKRQLAKELDIEYSVGNVFPGNMDITYFYVVTDYLKRHKLKLGLVLSHNEMKFEVWIFGQTKDVQEKYWHIFKNTKWATRAQISKYSVIEEVIVDNPDFNNLDKLLKKIMNIRRQLSCPVRDNYLGRLMRYNSDMYFQQGKSHVWRNNHRSANQDIYERKKTRKDTVSISS